MLDLRTPGLRWTGWWSTSGSEPEQWFGIEARAGRAEKIPLPDASVDAVTVGQAFHWFDPESAFVEMRRVARPGAGFALLWNQFNRDDPLLRAVDDLLRSHDPVRRSRWRDHYDPHLFGPLEENAFFEVRPMTADQLAAWVASTSRVIAAPSAEQAQIDREVRRLSEAHPDVVTIRTHVVAAGGIS